MEHVEKHSPFKTECLYFLLSHDTTQETRITPPGLIPTSYNILRQE